MTAGVLLRFYVTLEACDGFCALLLPPAGEDRDQRGQQAADAAGPRLPAAGERQESPAAARSQAHQLHTAGECETTTPRSFRRLPNPFRHVASQRLDVAKETIELVHSNPTETRDLPRSVPKDTPRYHLFLYKHSHEGDYLESVGMSVILTASVQKARLRASAHLESRPRDRRSSLNSLTGI